MIELHNVQKIVEKHTLVAIDECVVKGGEIVAFIGPVAEDWA